MTETTIDQEAAPLPRCSMCRHPAESHRIDPETGFRPCRSVGHPKGLNCADCERLTSPEHVAALMDLRNADDPLLKTAFAAYVVTRDHVRRQFGDAEAAFFTDIHESAVASALVEIRTEVEAELRQVRLVGEIFMERVDATRTALISLDQAITGIGDAPAEAEVRAAYDDLVATLGLPKEL